MIVKKEQDEILDYLEDASNLQGGKIECVFIPGDEEEVIEVVRECNAGKRPLTISAGGTGTVGGRIPLGGAVLSTEKLNKIIEINSEERYAVLQAGVIVDDFLNELSGQKLFYPPFPTERTAFIGGNVATNASGEYSFKFGSTREYVRGLKVVLSDGSMVRIKRGEVSAKEGCLQIPSTDIRVKVPSYRKPRVKKNAAGYYTDTDMDLIDLFIGSEGTLGIVTEVEVQIIEELPDFFFCAVFLKDERDVFSMVADFKEKKEISSDLLWLEYFDRNALRFLSEFYSQVPAHAAGCILFAAQSDSAEKLEKWDELLSGYNPLDIWFADNEKQKEVLFEFRHKVPEIMNEVVKKNSFIKVAADIVVPEDKFWQMDGFYRENLSSSKIEYIMFGHIGENHLHVNLLPRNEEEFAKARELHLKFARRAVELGGTVSGEHGIGKRKHELLKIMYGEEGIKQMADIKKAVDKSCILGLDNVFSRDYLK